ncbi:MAG TPA: hypothetical protein VNX88_08035 [Terriglobales bacterium]|jgi:hypothetical protein|nr:hypothetical protein [Terriglobales bacterium]
MTIRRPRFEVHKAQKVAAVFLILFVVQCLWLVSHLPLSMAETRSALAGRSLWSLRQLANGSSPLIPGDSILELRCAGLLPSIARSWATDGRTFSIYAPPNRWLVRLPFVLFGAWLGAALWWVARRIFGNEGGYVALGLYCFSPAMLLASATVGSGILAAWGLFGLIYTAIGVAHTLYAPPKKWRPRIVLLGLAIGLTAAASVPAAVVGLAFATAFMLYLAPGRRAVSIAILALSTVIGVGVLLLCFGFNARDLSAAALLPNAEYFRVTSLRLMSLIAVPGGLLEILAFVSCLFVFAFWKRSRYFGNSSALIPALLLPWWPGRFFPSASIIWTLPYALVFIGGIYADLLELYFFGGDFRRHVAATAVVLIGASAVFSLMLVAGA